MSDTKKDAEQLKKQLEPLKSAIKNARPPYCAGTLPLKPEELVLFYGREDPISCRRIDFSDVTDQELEHLSNVCEKARFGRNQEDVLDESYRKAGKLDTTYFAAKIDLERSGLMNFVRYNLLQGQASHRPIRAEMYKLNVYGKDSFFKSHKDTPRSSDMFGSLVIVLPTQHEGGALILRHKEKEWAFDSAREISESADPKTYIGYVSFFSDVDHEVTVVKSGYRVTLTYNLYYDDGAALKTLKIAKTLPLNESHVKNALKALIEDQTFLPEGGHLGFGLNHEYPVEIKPKSVSTLRFISRNLKGSDASVMQACKELKLDARLYFFSTVFEEYDYILPRSDAFEEGGFPLYNEDSNYEDYLLNFKYYGGKLIAVGGDAKVDFPVQWVTDRTDFNQLKFPHDAFGNDSMASYMYGQFCLIVKVGKIGERETEGQEERDEEEADEGGSDEGGRGEGEGNKGKKRRISEVDEY